MGVREKMNAYPGLSIVGVVVLLVAMVAEAHHFLRSPSVPTLDSSKVTAPLVCYTLHEGATFFPGYDNQNAPVDSSGKPAVKAYVYWCGGRQIVQRLEKYSNGPGSSLMVKKPGVGDWVSDSNPAAAAIRVPRCPGGETPAPVRASD